jgi:glyoxylase-like metal-dependent hydrolase (beta-lactamase superfamily II)
LPRSGDSGVANNEVRKVKYAVSVLIALAAALSGVVVAAEGGSSVEVRRLTERLYMLSTDQGDYTTNSLAFVGEDGLLLVDTQAEDDAEALKRAVDALGKGAPKYIINTHRHVEHVGGNAVFGPDPVVIAHALVPLKLRSGSYVWEEFPEATFPDITLEDSLSLFFNGERIDVIALAGSHDDNEIIVHFTESKVVHLSSLTNGFNFPSVDHAGDVLRFAELVARAIDLLPGDVTIVSGHNDVGTPEDLRSYHEMLIQTTEAVRRGLAAGKDVATLQEEGVLDAWSAYAGSYVGVDRWIEYLVEGLQGTKDTRETVFEPLYHVWKEQGAEAAVDRYFALKREHAAEYRFAEHDLLIIGDKLLKKQRARAAVRFLEAGLSAYPDSRYGYYANYRLAQAHRSLGETDLAESRCRKALELNPAFEPAALLLDELKQP